MEEAKIEVTKKLVLKDGTELGIEEFNAEDGKVSVTLLDMGYQKAIEILKVEQIADIQILNELGEVVLTAKGYSLGNRIYVNTKENTTTVTFEVKETREAVVDAAKAIQTLQNTSEQNTADITAINEAIASLAEIVGGE
uniref:Uncharacterized protein n=1 Tax=Siphoviridae sp. ctfW121 TaxID=2826413 RepID=A0A8S5N7Y3_9CAUD|nr:MAG TPA: hypothetical protein [Siphoviridae sp. ctfW121]